MKTLKTTNVNLGVKTHNGYTKTEHEHGSFEKAFSYDTRQGITSDTLRIKQKSQTFNKEYNKPLVVKTPKTTNVKLGVKTPNGHTNTEHEYGSFEKAFSSDSRQENISDP